MRKPAKWAGAAILTGTVLRVLFLGSKSLWFDEASTLVLAGRPLAELTSFLVRNEMNPPLYYALMHCWLQPFSDPRIGLRLFSALCGIAALFAFHSLADRLLPERARLPALALASISSFWIHVAQDGRSYSLLLLVSLLSTLAVVELSEKPTRRLWAWYAVFAALGLWTHYYYAILLAGHAAWLASCRPRARDYLIAHAAIAMSFAPWLPRLAAQMRLHVWDPVVGEALTIPRVLDLLGTTFFDVTFLGLVLPAWTGVAIGAYFFALAIRARAGDRRAFAFCATHVAAALGLIAAVETWSGRPVTQARYFIPISPMLILLAASGLRGKVSRLVIGVVAGAGCAGYFFSAVMVDTRLGALSDLIRRSSDASVPVVHLGKYYYLPLRVYYMPERRHLLVASEAASMDFRGMPPYPGVIENKDLPGLGSCIVVDASRTLSPDRVRLGTGAQLAAILGVSGLQIR